MAKSVLVAYGSKYGATAEIAERIGQTLREKALQADVLSAERVKDPGAYQAVVLGSAVYIGQWRKNAADFLKRNEAALARLPVWLFSSGPSGRGDPKELVKGWVLPADLQPVADRVRPRDVAVFHGNLNERKANLLEKWLVKNVGGEMGDFRDWQAVAAWAAGIAGALQ